MLLEPNLHFQSESAVLSSMAHNAVFMALAWLACSTLAAPVLAMPQAAAVCANAGEAAAACGAGNAEASAPSCCSGLVCSGTACVTAPPKALCCVQWCRSSDRFRGKTYDTESRVASDTTTGCNAATGCTCAVSAYIADKWRTITSEICGAHNFATTCSGGCTDNDCPTIDISGSYDAVTDKCICTGTTLDGALTKNIWSSDCAENSKYSTSFQEACPGTPLKQSK